MLNPLMTAFYAVLAVLKCKAEAELVKTYSKWRALQASIAEEEATAMLEPDIETDLFNLIAEVQQQVEEDDGSAVYDVNYIALVWSDYLSIAFFAI